MANWDWQISKTFKSRKDKTVCDAVLTAATFYQFQVENTTICKWRRNGWMSWQELKAMCVISKEKYPKKTVRVGLAQTLRSEFFCCCCLCFLSSTGKMTIVESQFWQRFGDSVGRSLRRRQIQVEKGNGLAKLSTAAVDLRRTSGWEHSYSYSGFMAKINFYDSIPMNEYGHMWWVMLVVGTSVFTAA